MLFLKQKFCFLLLALAFLASPVFGQGKINTPKIDCLGNITSMSYTPPIGLTLASATWYFGDGGTSTNNSPTHVYSAKGTFTIKIDAVFTNSSTQSDSVKIEIVGLPNSCFFRMPKVDTCLSKNKICYKDTSTPAIAGQTITRRLIVWGDGNFTTTSGPSKGDIICHIYAVQAKYTIKCEVTDIYGCKNSTTTSVGILNDVVADAFIETSWYDCNTKQLCVKNNSIGINLRAASYKWQVDTFKVDTNANFNPKKCFFFKSSRTGNVSLKASMNGCLDTFKKGFSLTVDSLPKAIEMSDTEICKTESISAEVEQRQWDNFSWTLDNVLLLPKPPHQPLRTLSEISPGKHVLKANFTRGNCVFTLTRNFKVLGPMTSPRAFGNNQCFSNRQMFFVDSSLLVKRSNCKFKWTIEDPYGDNCVSHRAKGQNLYKNCNTSLDWYTKHQYASVRDSIKVGYRVTDTTTGCSDSSTIFIKLRDCPPILKKDSVNLCSNDPFLIVNPQTPISVTFNGGKKWLKFPVVLDSSYSGYYDVGMVFETLESPWAENFGNDSFKIHKDTMHYFDTVYRKKFLHVHRPKIDTFSTKLYHCKPIRASVFLKNKRFAKGEKISINWYDGKFEEFKPQQDTIIDSFSHFYKGGGVNTLCRVIITSSSGCEYNKTLDLKEGKVLGGFNSRFECLENQVCFSPFVYDNVTGAAWKYNTANNKVKWNFPDTLVNNFRPCFKFKKGGMQHYEMVMNDSFGCTDTLRDSILIQDLRANVTHQSKIIYCSELKQFLDSSRYIKGKGEGILKYAWQFGDGVYSSFVKDPLQVINTALDKIHVYHAVETVSGCKDTIDYEIQIIGPKPYFVILDTIGCGSLRAEFKNLSKYCKTYNWSFGDQNGSNYQTDSTNSIFFNYTKPGRYRITLTGLDTVYNPISGNTYYCKTTFPDKDFQKDTNRSVLVLPFGKTGIQSIDTICLGNTINFSSKSDTIYQYDEWQMGDSTSKFKLSLGTGFDYRYAKEGLYTVRLNPGYTNPIINNQCRDSAQKQVLVLGVEANFTTDPLVIPPLFQFYNQSTPSNATLKWNFGQSATGNNNTSTLRDPTHNYGNDTGYYSVCLIATLPYGCADTICKTVFNDHLSDFQLFNVFTPGNIDGKNDEYDILIEAESLYDLIVYNRWGVEVFMQDKDGDPTTRTNWNGKVMNTGAECPPGTYYYLFKYALRTKPDEIKTLSGVITLIR